jgi:hypothetical protein
MPSANRQVKQEAGYHHLVIEHALVLASNPELFVFLPQQSDTLWECGRVMT